MALAIQMGEEAGRAAAEKAGITDPFEVMDFIAAAVDEAIEFLGA